MSDRHTVDTITSDALDALYRRAENADRAAVLLWGADALDAELRRFFTEFPDEPENSPYALGRKDAGALLRRLAAEAQPTTRPKTVSAAYARLQAAAKEATEAAHLHAMRGMRAVYQLCRQYGFGDVLIPASEVLAALGLDENANTVEPAAGVRQDGAQQ